MAPVNPIISDARNPMFFRLTAYTFSIFEKKAIFPKEIKKIATTIIR